MEDCMGMMGVVAKISKKTSKLARINKKRQVY